MADLDLKKILTKRHTLLRLRRKAGLLLCTLLILPTLILTSPGCNQPARQIEEGIRLGEQLYNSGNLLSAERTLTDAIELAPRESAVAEAYYLRGLVRLKLGNTILAEQDLIKALELAKREDLKTNAHICLGSIYYDKGQWQKTYDHYIKVVDKLNKASPSDWILYRLGLVSQRLGRWDKAKLFFARLIREFPRSEAARLAEAKMQYEAFTIQAGAFKEYRHAQTRIEELKRLGLEANIKKKGGLYIVYIGSWPTRKEAEKIYNKLKNKISDLQIIP